MLKTYTMLTKPGIILGNAITTAGGFALASRGAMDFRLLLTTLAGLSFIIASAGVFNNYIDRAIDAKMQRTKDRALAKGTISVRNALFFASLLGSLGVWILSLFTNGITVLTALFGFVVYLTLYAFLKYRSFYGTLFGSIAGAVPPVVGYCAVSNQFDFAAFILFAILILWQMPHFFSIAIYRIEDYAAASIPVLPLKKGLHATKRQMLLYIVAFIFASLLLPAFGYTGAFYSWIALSLGALWLALCLNGFKQNEDIVWGRQMFFCSLLVILGLCCTIFLEFCTFFS